MKTIEEWQAADNRWRLQGYSVWANIKGDRFTLWDGKPSLFIYPYLAGEINPELQKRLDRWLENDMINWTAVPFGTNGKGNELFKVLPLDKDGNYVHQANLQR